MSAICTDQAAEGAAPEGNPSADRTRTTFSFSQQEPIPSYLLALVCGELACRPIGPRSAVWAEEAYVDAAAYEFSETEAPFFFSRFLTLLSIYLTF